MTKVAFVSGANRGIGFETSKKLAETWNKNKLSTPCLPAETKATSQCCQDAEISSIRN